MFRLTSPCGCRSSIRMDATSLTAAFTLALALSASANPITTVTVGGSDYRLTTVQGTFSDFQTELQGTPWWGNQSLASALAAAAMLNLGDALGNTPSLPNGSGAYPGVFFVFAYDDDVTPVQYLETSGGSQVTVQAVSSATPYSWAVVAEEVPDGGGSLGLLALGGMGLLGVRRCVRPV